MDLSGAWLAHPADGDLSRRFHSPTFDDGDWVKAAVPGHWRSVPELAESDGPVLFRHRFESPPPTEGRRRFLVLNGVFYFADTWLDGAYLGATEGYFMPHAFDVTELAEGGSDHVVAVEVGCPAQTDRTHKRLLTGVFSHWDCLDTTWNPGGIWRPVEWVETGPVRIESLRVVCREATEERGRLGLVLELDAPEEDGVPAPPVRLHARLTGPGVECEIERDEQLAGGANHIEWMVEVDRPPLWWPWRLGDQPLCDLTVTVEVAGEASDSRQVRTAFREVRMDQWTLHVNGERLYVMGSNQGPTRMELAEATADDFRRDVELAVDANLDMLRVHAHVSRPELYEVADEAGLLLWQDFPLQWSYTRGIRKEAVREARAMVDLLGHHPSVAIWCAHNEPFALDGDPDDMLRSPGKMVKGMATMFGPTWNKQILDRSIRRAIRSADGTRPVNIHSGVLPGPVSPGTDTHFYFGWYHGHMADMPAGLRAWPRLARFVSEFGAQAVPVRAEFMEGERWPDLDWERLAERHCLQLDQFDRHVPPADYPDFESWQQATQSYQAALVQLQVEDLRRLKYRPTGGFLHFCFADSLPAVTWSVLDHTRTPKPGYSALRDACRPVLGMLDPRTGDVHVVNEGRDALEGVLIDVAVGDRRWRFTGDVPADGIAFVGKVEMGDTSTATVVTSVRGETVVNEYGPVLMHAARNRPAKLTL